MDSRDSGTSEGSLRCGKVASCSTSQGPSQTPLPSKLWTVVRNFLSSTLNSSKGLSLGGVSMIPRYRISWRGTVLVFGAFFLLGFAAGLSSSLACLSSSFECFVASKYVIFLFCFVFSFVLSLCGLSVVLVEESMDISSLPGSLATFPGSGVIAAVTSLVDWRFVVGVAFLQLF